MADKLSGMLASAVVKVARDKLVTALGDATAAAMPDEKLRSHMEELKQRMEAIAQVAGNAERRSTEEKVVREWLERCEDAAYGIWDMVDDIQANQWKPQVTEMHRPCLPIPIATARRGRMQAAIENLDDLLQLGQGKLQQPVDDDVDDAPPTITPSFADYSEDDAVVVVGRESDRAGITFTILSAARDQSSGLVFVPILGMPGVGKSTLAEIVFCDSRITSDYARAWVTVGEVFDLKKIGNCILSQLSNKGEHQDSSDVESIMKRLQYKLSGLGNKQALVVLDDLHSHDFSDLEGLMRMLGAGKEGSKVIVIVTTTYEFVWTLVGPMALVYELSSLSVVDSLKLLLRKLGIEARPDNITLQRQLDAIAGKCRGLPLAIHSIGSTLRSESPEEIRSLLYSDIWEWAEEDTSVSPPVLLSYLCMPPNLRLCFAYCAIFPRGHSILKDDLIQHWTALQLIQPSDTLSTTQLGNKYIDKLLDMSFLKRTMLPFSDDRCEVPPTLQNLAHDLAMKVSHNNHQFFRNSYREESLTNSSGILSARLRAFSFHGCSTNQLRDDSFSSAKYLRVLDLRDCCLQKLPDSVSQLGQLRYLNLSGSTRLLNLPDWFGNLINLGHIDLSGCSGLLKLLDSFGNLTSVLHVNLSGCVGLKSLPESFGNLTNVVHVNLSGCVGLKSLPKSFGLLEKLEYLDLSSCSCLEGIQSALGHLTNLQHLNLSHPCCYLGKQRIHHLQVPFWGKLINLRYLNLSMCLNPILCYLTVEERNEYIGCISGLRSLEHLDLSHNIFIFEIPQSLGQLSQLQTLNLFGCARIKRIEKWMGERNFPSKSLVVSNCLGLEMYQFVVRTDRETKSSNLSQLKDVICEELEISCLEKAMSTVEAKSIGLAQKKKLQKLKLVWTVDPEGASSEDHKALLEELVPPQNLQCFELHGYSSKHLPAWLTSRLSFHINLQRLILRRVAKVTRIDTSCFHGLLHVTLDNMVNLEEFSYCSRSSSSDELVMFPALEELVINKCPKLRLGDSPLRARMLVISDCVHLMTSSVTSGEHYTVENPSSSTSAAITCAPVTEVVIESCKVPLDELKWSLLRGLAPLHSLHIRNYSEKIMSPEIMKGHLSSLKLLCFSHCDSITNLPEHVVQDTSLQELLIHGCRGIKSLPQSICEEKRDHYPLLRIQQCPELKKWCDGLDENKRNLARKYIRFEGESSSSEAETSMKRTD